MATVLSLLLRAAVDKWRTLPETVADLTRRTVIITGANVGLGFEAAKRFYAMNPSRLILAVRSVSKGEDAKKVIIESGKKEGPPGTVREETRVDVWALDLTSFESVRSFAKKCDEELDRVDILLENAAIQTLKWSLTKDGWEADLQTNVLSTFLLAALLAPLVAKTCHLPAPAQSPTLKPHLVIVASDAHFFAAFRVRNEKNILAALNDKAHYNQNERYPDSKAVGLLLSQQLAKSPALKDVVVCSVNPGSCRSELMRAWPQWVRSIIYGITARTAAEGSKTYTWASLTNDIPVGAYTSSCTVAAPGGVVISNDAEKIRSQLWNEVTAVLVKEAPQAESVLKF
ncbi:hypothetical protein M408DRAFT_27996 [Serendipita vermifera MAFF 305830]|uniref:Ketoreductase (KR) domain-containing protein n=1 Tax=Serendipita vermifera MAFF 305830 TaxID=933852 RepID=A0A0C3ATF8_SERVB|nr:hypothetical protein M408DRAFT_27996 [Serendipita vermifera MAFF 305830]